MPKYGKRHNNAPNKLKNWLCVVFIIENVKTDSKINIYAYLLHNQGAPKYGQMH